MDTESLAVSAVKTSISKTDLMSPIINEKDKEPVCEQKAPVALHEKGYGISCTLS